MYQKDDINLVPQDDSPHQKWRFEGNYDYYGNKTDQPSLIVMGQPMDADLESEINMQINKELFAHYTFLSMGFHFYRDDINLPNMRDYFKTASEEEMKHANMFIEYLLKRGGQLKLNPVMNPCRHHWGGARMAMEDALALHKQLLQSLRNLYDLAFEKRDPQMADFIATTFFDAQTDRIKQLSNYINTLRRRTSGRVPLGEYQFDKLTLGD